MKEVCKIYCKTFKDKAIQLFYELNIVETIADNNFFFILDKSV